MGLVTWAQMRAAGIDHNHICVWRRQKRLVPVHGEVVRVAGAPGGWRQSLMAAQLAEPSLVISHRAAAALWGLPTAEEVEASVPRRLYPRLKGVILHRSGDLVPEHVTEKDGFRITRPQRTILDLGAVVGPALVHVVLRVALERQLVTPGAVNRVLYDVSKHGRRGAGVLRAILAEAMPDVSRSALESRMRLVLAGTAGTWAEQYEFVTPTGIIRVDFIELDALVVIEVDGYIWHRTPQQLQRDLQRQNQLIGLGLLVLRYTWDDVTRRFGEVQEEIDRVVASRRSGNAHMHIAAPAFVRNHFKEGCFAASQIPQTPATRRPSRCRRPPLGRRSRCGG